MKPIRVILTWRDEWYNGRETGKAIVHAELAGPSEAPFTGCPLGRGRDEDSAIRDLLRPGYSLPYEGRQYTIADVEVVERRNYIKGPCEVCGDLTTAEVCGPCTRRRHAVASRAAGHCTNCGLDGCDANHTCCPVQP